MNYTTKNSPKTRCIFYCEKCDYTCAKKGDFTKHSNSIKHNTTNTTIIQPKYSPTHVCGCGKEYNHRASLFNHKKKCTYTTEDKEEEPENTIVLAHNESSNTELLTIIREVMVQLVEKDKQIAELIPRVGNNTTNNNHFNVMVYLNEHCKDAISIQQFMADIVVTEDDIIYMSKHKNVVDNIGYIIRKSLNSIETTKRPIHCTDEHRGTIYIKHDNGWDNDKKRERNVTEIKLMEKWMKTDTKDPILTKAMKKTLNITAFVAINSYKHSHPNGWILDSPEYVMTSNALINSFVDCTDEVGLNHLAHKITKHMCSAIRLDKTIATTC